MAPVCAARAAARVGGRCRGVHGLAEQPSVQLAAGNEAHLKAATKLEASGDLSVRLAVALNYGYFDSPESLDTEYGFIQQAGKYKSEFVDPGYVKIFMDGLPTSRTG